jgi:hypothetical protein
VAYCLHALIGPTEALRTVTHSHLRPPVELDSGFSLMPIDDERLDEDEAIYPSDIDAMQTHLHDAVAPASRGTVIAYVVHETFGGGPPDSGAVVWSDGLVVYEEWVEDAPREIEPTALALRLIGVVAEPGIDEFDTIGLGRHRMTEDWE